MLFSPLAHTHKWCSVTGIGRWHVMEWNVHKISFVKCSEVSDDGLTLLLDSIHQLFRIAHTLPHAHTHKKVMSDFHQLETEKSDRVLNDRLSHIDRRRRRGGCRRQTRNIHIFILIHSSLCCYSLSLSLSLYRSLNTFFHSLQTNSCVVVTYLFIYFFRFIISQFFFIILYFAVVFSFQ